MIPPWEGVRHKLEHFGELTAGNVLDWLITLGIGAAVAVQVQHWGGYMPAGRPALLLAWWIGGLVALHALSWLVPDRQPEVHPHGWIFLPWLLWLTAPLAGGHPAPWLGELAAGCAWAVFLIGWLVLHHVRSREQIAVLLFMLLAAGAASAVGTLYQLLHIPEWLPGGRPLALPVEAARQSGSFARADGLAVFLSLLMPLLVLLLVARRLRRSLRWLTGFVLLLATIGLVLAARRELWLALVPVVLLSPLFLFRNPAQRVVAWGGMVLVIALAVWAVAPMGGNWRALAAELDLDLLPAPARTAWAMFLDRPHTGQGVGAYAFRFDALASADTQTPATGPGNFWLGTLAEQGWPGLVLLLAPLLFIVMRAWSVWQKTPFLALPVGGETRITPVPKILLGWLLLTAPGAILLGAWASPEWTVAVGMLVAVMLALVLQRLTKQRWRPNDRWSVRMLCAGIALVVAAGVAMRGTIVGRGTAEYFQAMERWQAYLRDPRTPRHGEAYLERTRRLLRYALDWLPSHADARAGEAAVQLQISRIRPEERTERGRHALAQLDRALSQTSHWRYEMRRAVALARLGRPPAEIEAATRVAVALAPTRAEAWYQRASILAEQPGCEDVARTALDEVFTLDPAHQKGRILASRLTSP